MLKEFSAGGIVYKTTNAKRFWLIAQHSHHKGWVFPKGLISDNKKDESSQETAVREVQEETGIKGKIIKKLPSPVSYFYSWQGQKRFKSVEYYLMEYESGETSDHDWEMSQVEWLPEEEIEQKLTFKSDKIAFNQALSLCRLMDRPQDSGS